MDWTRRDLLLGAVGAGASWALADGELSLDGVEDQPLAVPSVPDQRILSSARHGISEATHAAHFRLWQGYATKTNELRGLLKNSAKVTAGANQIYSEMRALKVNYAFAYGGYLNHEAYFDIFGGDQSTPSGDLARLIEMSYGSVADWAKDFKATGLAGRGWVFMALDHRTRLVQNLIGDSQDTFPMWNHTLLLAMDVYEHAYYLDFQTNRGAYIDAFLKCVDWDRVARRLPRR